MLKKVISILTVASAVFIVTLTVGALWSASYRVDNDPVAAVLAFMCGNDNIMLLP